MNLMLKLFSTDDISLDWILLYPCAYPGLCDARVANRLDALIADHTNEDNEITGLKVFIPNPAVKYGVIAISSIMTYCIAYRLGLELFIADENIDDYVLKKFEFSYL